MESAEKAGKLLDKLFSVAIEKVETIIDEELEQTHDSIAKEVESSFSSILRKLGYSAGSCSFISGQIQSGGVFNPG